MFQKTYQIDSLTGLSEAVKEIRAYDCNPSHSLLILLPEVCDRSDIEDSLTIIQSHLPEISIAGIINNPMTSRFEMPARTGMHLSLSLIHFETSSVHFVLSDLSTTSERNAAGDVRKQLAQFPDAKAIMVFSSGLQTDTELYMHCISKYYPDIPLFGSTAGIGNLDNRENSSFIICEDKLCSHALLSIIFEGPHLSVAAGEEFGWTPIGREMTITKTAGRRTVLEIDHAPACEIYHRYLGLSRNQILTANTCEFPIFKKSGERIVARISVNAGEDGSVEFGSPISTGEKVRFSYGNPEDILRATQRNAAQLEAFDPQALFIVFCMNRFILLGKDQGKEIGYFHDVLENLAIMHGGSELFEDRLGGGELNSALVYAAMREDATITCHVPSPLPEVQVPEESLPSPDVVPLTRRLLTFLNVTTRELEDLRENLDRDVQEKTAEIVRQQKSLNAINREIVMTLSNAIDAKDAYTNGHSRRVAEYAVEIARRYGYDKDALEKVYMIGVLHDVGKIGIPDGIINKPGRLNDEEFAMIKRHPSIGADILSGITEFPEIAFGARWHHERYDGRGYPDGLQGEEIPEIAQIISVADAYDAMTSNRSYRATMPQEKVRAEIEKGRGTQFAPKFADIMLEMIDDDVDYRMRGNFSQETAQSD